jgi:membrane-associated phospholipid phosphatase
MSLKEVIKRNLFFFVPYFIALIILFPLFILASKTEIHVFINQHCIPVLDYIFKYVTSLGDGLFAVLVSILFLLISFRKSLFIFLTFAAGGLFVQILKRLLFHNMLRPVKFFDGLYDLHVIEGVKIRYYMSFPSGHAATAFGLFLCLAVMTKSNLIKSLCFVMASLVAFSRVYLSQHFLIDVYFGSMIGVAFALLFYQMLFSSGKKWLDRDLLYYVKAR